MESNDSPEIPDRGETSDIPGLLSRWERERERDRDRDRERKTETERDRERERESSWNL